MIIRTVKRFGLLAGSLLLFLPVSSFSKAGDHTGNDPSRSIFDVLSRPDILELTIKTDLSTLIEERATEDYLEAVLSYADESGTTVERKMEIRPRGKFRRRVCDFPPVKIKFSKKELLKEGLAEFNDLKLVTHCMDEKLTGNENVFKEYLVYKMYRELTDKSYRVQLVRITYEDTRGNLGKVKRFGFLIEDTAELASRLGGESCDCMGEPYANLDPASENLAAFFQFMIGNADWNTLMLRNIKLIQPLQGDKKIMVPYDFDFSGVVNASYALPDSDHNLTSVQDRIFLGAKTENSLLFSTIDLLKSKRSDLVKVILDFKPLSRTGQNEMIEYLNIFYEQLDRISSDPAQLFTHYLKAGQEPQWLPRPETGTSTVNFPDN